MLLTWNEAEVFEDLKSTLSIGMMPTSLQDIMAKVAQEKRHKATAVASIKTYLNTVPHIKEALKQ